MGEWCIERRSLVHEAQGVQVFVLTPQCHTIKADGSTTSTENIERALASKAP